MKGFRTQTTSLLVPSLSALRPYKLWCVWCAYGADGTNATIEISKMPANIFLSRNHVFHRRRCRAFQSLGPIRTKTLHPFIIVLIKESIIKNNVTGWGKQTRLTKRFLIICTKLKKTPAAAAVHTNNRNIFCKSGVAVTLITRQISSVKD